MDYYKETIDLLKNSSFYYIISIGMDSRYSYVSPNYDENFKYVFDTLLGEPFHVTIHPDDTVICAEVAGQCFADPGGLYPATLRKNDGKGGYIFTQWEFKALFDKNNQPDGIMCIGYNITEHIATKNALKTVTEEVSQKELKLTEIAYINSHLIRRPLANILGLASVISQMKVDENIKSIFKLLIQSADELDMEIKNIADKT